MLDTHLRDFKQSSSLCSKGSYRGHVKDKDFQTIARLRSLDFILQTGNSHYMVVMRRF